MTAPLRNRTVHLRCGRCGRRLPVTMESGLDGRYQLDPTAAPPGTVTKTTAADAGPLSTHATIRCRCGYAPTINIADAEAAAPHAFEMSASLTLGVSHYGLPRLPE